MFGDTSNPSASAAARNFSYSLLSCRSARIFQMMTVNMPISSTTPIADPAATVTYEGTFKVDVIYVNISKCGLGIRFVMRVIVGDFI